MPLPPQSNHGEKNWALGFASDARLFGSLMWKKWPSESFRTPGKPDSREFLQQNFTEGPPFFMPDEIIMKRSGLEQWFLAS